jgi:hypothetical protein
MTLSQTTNLGGRSSNLFGCAIFSSTSVRVSRVSAPPFRFAVAGVRDLARQRESPWIGHFRPPSSFGEETWCATEKLPTASLRPLGNWTS